MRFTKFIFKNFKGIESLEFDLSRNAYSKVCTLVGLNESGKTTLLEAMNYFAYKTENLEALKLDGYKIEDIHGLIPISKRDNFNDFITIEGQLELDENDIVEIKKDYKSNDGYELVSLGKQIVYTQNYAFEKSIHVPKNDKNTWKVSAVVKKTRGSKHFDVLKISDEANRLNKIIKSRIPVILYYPNFLFEFPEKIYLESTVADKKHEFYRSIVQDILDSIGNGLNIADHIISRAQSGDAIQKRNLASVIGKMNKVLTDEIFQAWNRIFQKTIKNKEIELSWDIDTEKGVYIEFFLKDNTDLYRISERSLGFRWFFVFLLVTHFRSARKKGSPIIYLFDEPASNLHPAAQTQLLKSFENLPRVIYTTHSHYLINPNWLESTFVVKNEAIDYSKEEDFSFKQTRISVYKYRDFVSKFPADTSYFQPILEVLDYRPSMFDLSEYAVLTEGKNDFYNYTHYLNSKGIDTQLKFIPGTSSSTLSNLIALYIGWNKPFVVLLDSDDAGIKEAGRYLETFGEILKDRLFLYSEIEPLWIDFEVEDLYSKSDRLLLQQACYPDTTSFNKKVFGRSVQELLVKGTYYNLDTTTTTNFDKVLKFLEARVSSQVST